MPPTLYICKTRTTPTLPPAPRPLLEFRILPKTLLSAVRYVAIGFPGVFALFLILRAFVDGNTADLRYAFGMMILLGLSICVPTPPVAQRDSLLRRVAMLAIVLIPVLAIFPLTVVVLIFGKIDMAAFVFHLIFGMDGTPWGDILPFIFTAAVLWATVMIVYARLMPRFPFGFAVPILLGAGILAANPLVNDLALNRANAAFGPARTVLPEFRDPRIVDAPKKPNLVILYLEGFDRGYLDTARFGDIAAPLAALERRGISFTDIAQIEATGWSLAGTIATQCGAPLLPFGAKPLGDTSSIQRIMPDVICLSDILKDRGYNTTYMSGAKIIGNQMGYYGFDNFYSTHGDVQIEDRGTIPNDRTKTIDPDFEDGWGLMDSELLDGAKLVIQQKAKMKAPFAVFIATMDTHGPAAGISPSCSPDGQPRMSEDMRDAVRCVSDITAEFVDSLITEYGPDLHVAVFSDHLNHASNLTSILEAAPRRNTAMLLGGGVTPAVISKPGSMVDVYPTLLDWLGLLAPGETRAGLGVSLLSDQPSLVQSIGFEPLNATLRVDTALAQHLWRNAEATPD